MSMNHRKPPFFIPIFVYFLLLCISCFYVFSYSATSAYSVFKISCSTLLAQSRNSSFVSNPFSKAAISRFG